jgi:uncharacterized oligopeptide transporter (OPT) family protein
MKNMSKYILYVAATFIAFLALWFVVDFNKNLVRVINQRIESDRASENYENK